jgi:ectoine hydroxylase-related dioxygenase (phytanoyl-CoA dioxygenase family)
MNDDEKYFFDLQGYLVLRDVVDLELIARCNHAIDHNTHHLETPERRFEGESKALTSAVRQQWHHGLIDWEPPWCDPFRELMVQPRLKPYLAELLGGGYRLANVPALIAMEKGCAGHLLHGGRVDRQPFTHTYMCKFGKIYPSLLLLEFPLADEGPGDGGLAVIPGGHKANYPIPQSLRFYEAYQDEVVEVHARAGDAVLFAEPTIHGTLKWQGEHQRRALLYSYRPSYQATRLFHQVEFPDYVEDMSEEQQALLKPPQEQ